MRVWPAALGLVLVGCASGHPRAAPVLPTPGRASLPATTSDSPSPSPSPSPSSSSVAPSSAAAPLPAKPSVVMAPPSPLPTCAGVVSTWSVQQLVARVIAVPVNMSGPAAVAPLVRQGAGAVVLLGSSPAGDIKTELATLHAAGSPAPFVMVDEEGGGIQHLSSLVGSLPWPRDAAASESPATMRANVARVGANLRALGVDVDLAPVLDLSTGPGPDASHPDGSRSFSGSASVAATYGQAFVAGLQDGREGTVVKHFPGLGTADNNTDSGPATTAPLATLQGADLLPFEALVNSGAAVMVSNATTPGLTTIPAGLSPAVVNGLLRQQLGFAGVVLSDSLTAGAISQAGYTIPQAAVAAVEAGVDVVLFGSTPTTGDAPADFAQITNALQSAVSNGGLSMDRLHQAAAHALQLSPGVCRPA